MRRICLYEVRREMGMFWSVGGSGAGVDLARVWLVPGQMKTRPRVFVEVGWMVFVWRFVATGVCVEGSRERE